MPQVFWPFPVSTVTEWPASAGRPNHWGTDFGIAQGTPLRATIDGTIIRHNNDGLGAYVLDIVSDDGLLVRNGHLSRMDVNTGQRVTAGQVIGLTGGRPGTPGAGYSYGPHLHWELRWDRVWSGGRWVDPRRMSPPVRDFGGGSPIIIGDEEKFMRIVHATDGKAYLVTEDGFQWLPSPMYYDLFKRLINSSVDAPERFTPAEIEAMNGQLQDVARRNASAPAKVTAEVDYSRIAKTVNDDAARRLQG